MLSLSFILEFIQPLNKNIHNKHKSESFRIESPLALLYHKGIIQATLFFRMAKIKPHKK